MGNLTVGPTLSSYRNIPVERSMLWADPVALPKTYSNLVPIFAAPSTAVASKAVTPVLTANPSATMPSKRVV